MTVLTIFIGCKSENIKAYSELKKLAKPYSDIRIVGKDSVRIDRVRFEKISEIADTTIISATKLMKENGVINYTHNEGVYEFIQKSGYEFSEGVIYAGNEKVMIKQFDRLEKIGNEGWFRYQKTYTHYPE